MSTSNLGVVGLVIGVTGVIRVITAVLQWGGFWSPECETRRGWRLWQVHVARVGSPAHDLPEDGVLSIQMLALSEGDETGVGSSASVRRGPVSSSGVVCVCGRRTRDEAYN